MGHGIPQLGGRAVTGGLIYLAIPCGCSQFERPAERCFFQSRLPRPSAVASERQEQATKNYNQRLSMEERRDDGPVQRQRIRSFSRCRSLDSIGQKRGPKIISQPWRVSPTNRAIEE